jgi:methionine-rich copper-binding protein CopC
MSMKKRGIGMNIFFKITAPLFLCLVLASPATAHTSLLESTPKRDSIIAIMPKEIILVFGEDLLTINDSTNNYFEVFDSANDKLSLSEVNVDGAKLSARVLNNQIKAGKYSILYRVVAGDGHVVKGIVKFTMVQDISNSSPPIVNLTEETPTTIEDSKAEVLVQENFDNHNHGNFFHNHLEHILMVLVPFIIIIAWNFLRRKYSDS